MKKKFSAFMIFVCIFLLFSVTVAAFETMWDFRVDLDAEKMPNGTVYVELLLPISESDECYVVFNEANGEKYNISADSEIAKLNSDGFVSYTFHVSDAVSEMAPQYDEWGAIVTFAPDAYADLSRKGTYDCDYLAEKYKEAKFAYLDADGNVLGVSNSAKVWNIRAKIQGYYLDMSLSGLELESDFSYAPPIFLFLVLCVVCVAAVIIAFICKYFITLHKFKYRPQ